MIAGYEHVFAARMLHRQDNQPDPRTDRWMSRGTTPDERPREALYQTNSLPEQSAKASLKRTTPLIEKWLS